MNLTGSISSMKNNPEIVAYMPIKLNSERCKGKNIRMLGSKPLLQYALNTLKETNLCDSINVFCSSEKITSYLPEGVTFIKRPEYLDLPTSNFTQFTEAFLSVCDADIYVMVHATAPFITAQTMRECIEAVKSGEFDSAFCAQKIQTFLWKDNKPLNFDAGNLPRTQDLAPIFQETSGIYVFRKSVFQKFRRRIGLRPYIKVIGLKESVDIDEEEDFTVAEALLGVDL